VNLNPVAERVKSALDAAATGVFATFSLGRCNYRIPQPGPS
jgi:hypothetical protein